MSDFQILGKNDEVDTLYGLEKFHITIREINAILYGKALYGIVNDEYAITIELSKGGI